MRTLCLLFLLAVAGPAAAQPANRPPADDAIPIPGTSAQLAKVVGIEQPLPRSRVMREIVRLVHSGQNDEKKNLALGSLAGYLEIVNEYEFRLVRAVTDGTLSLALARQKPLKDRLEDVFDAAGFRLREKDKAFRIEKRGGDDNAARRQTLASAGLDVEAFERELNAGRSFAARLPSDEVPLPLPPDAWNAMLEKNVPLRSLLSTILSDRAAAFVYYGASSLDEETRAFLAANPELLRRLYNDRSGEFCAFAPGLRIAGSRVAVPGGRAAEGLWRAFLDESPAEPVKFVRALFSKDEGDFAYFYETVSLLDPPRLAFVLGPADLPAATRAERLRNLYEACRVPNPGWKPAIFPFKRTVGDFADLVARLAVTSDGRLVGPARYGLWSAVFDGADLPDDAARMLRDSSERVLLDAAALVELICVEEFGVRRDRLAAFLFAQEAFAAATEAQAPDILFALRGFLRYRMLALTLLRMEVHDPKIYVEALRHADRLSRISDDDRNARALCEFQGALGLVERAHFGRVIDPATAARLVRSLSAVPLSEDGEYSGYVAQWCEGELLPTLAAGTGKKRVTPAEELVLDALAGRPAPSGASQAVIWEDTPYAVDIVAPELERLKKVRAKTAGNSLDAVLAFARAAATIATSVSDLAQLRPAVAELAKSGKTLQQPGRLGWQTEDKPPELKKALAKADKDLQKIKKPKDLKKLPGIAEPLVRLADTCLAETLPELLYASALGDPNGAVLLGGRVAGKHDFAAHVPGLVPEARLRAPWSRPAQSDTAPWHVHGSLLGLDVALADLALRRVATERTPVPSKIFNVDRQGMAEAVALMNPRDTVDADRDRIVAALRRGRERVASPKGDGSDLMALGLRIGLGAERSAELAWAARHEDGGAAGVVSLAELFRMGLAEGERAPQAWGTSGVSANGTLGLRFPESLPWTLLAGRDGSPGLSAALVDLELLVAEALAERKLPASLARYVMAALGIDFAEEVRLAHPDDLYSAAAYVRAVARSRIDDYVASLTVDGPLLPASQPAVAREPGGREPR